MPFDEVARDALPVGHRVGEYEIVAVLSADSDFSFVYRVRDHARGDEAALKEFFPHADVRRDANRVSVVPRLAAYEPAIREARGRFLREAALLERVQHPNVVRIRGCLEANGTAYLAMDLVSGRTLQTLIEQLWHLGQAHPGCGLGGVAA